VPIRAVIGGFHLIGLPHFNTMAGSRADVEAIGRELARRCEGSVLTGHCTGRKAFAVLKAVLGDRLQRLTTGTVTSV
jgi:7,8-dihydropterin-6-yl-methyl-4-(beta-D-ribofuranosyl)aminobenzene 5'-phosphate synthase